MFAIIGGLLSSTISGVLSPLFGWLNKKQDVGLAEYQAASAEERDGYLAYVAALGASNTAKIAANNWSGAHLMVYAFGLPAAIHWSAVFLVSTFPALGWHPQALPAVYASAEQMIALSFFVLAPALPIVSSVTQMMNRR
jgi:hypothetical protein